MLLRVALGFILKGVLTSAIEKHSKIIGGLRNDAKRIDAADADERWFGQDHGLQPMDEVTIGDGLDGLNRVIKLGSIHTQFEAVGVGVRLVCFSIFWVGIVLVVFRSVNLLHDL